MDVNFELRRGKYFTIEVGYFDTVLEIKEKVQKYQGIPISHQTLVFNGQVLNDKRDVAYCEIYNNSSIQLLIAFEFDKSMNNSCNNNEKAAEDKHKKIQLNVKTPTSKIHVPIEMDLETSCTIIVRCTNVSFRTMRGSRPWPPFFLTIAVVLLLFNLKNLPSNSLSKLLQPLKVRSFSLISY
ncbi:hypothetical protein ACFX2H_036684 [Malus domestica]